ncbi:MAG: response regulator, partial [Candidatus Dadabacteria bacterium]
LELILLECNDPEKAEMVETAINNCGDVSDLLEDILAFSRYQAGKLTANKEIFNIVSCVSECAERFKISARARGLELSVDSEVDFRMVEADRKHVKRIISNLIGNAVKYTKFGSINVSVADCGNRIAVGIRDTGCGMTAEEVGRIFKPFERGALSGEERGTGLGLALSKVLTELNGGTIDVKSSPGKGSLFTLYLKRAQAESLAEAEMRAEDPLKYRDINILLVDDDSDLVRSLALGLKAAGLNVFTAVTVHDAESIMNFERIDLLISDAGMPDGGGERLVRYIKSQQPESRVIVMTGSDDSAISQTMYRLGADELFIKPVDFENILGWVRQTMAEEAGREVRSVRA